jgi:hypothetical protein
MNGRIIWRCLRRPEEVAGGELRVAGIFGCAIYILDYNKTLNIL